MRPKHVTALLLLGTCLGACKGNTATAGMGRTERERDSIIGQSKVPGAGVVHRALDVSDSAQRRGAKLDSAATQP